MKSDNVDIESYKNLLLFAMPVTIYGLKARQMRIRDLLCSYDSFNATRQFVYLTKDTMHKDIKSKIDEYMFDIKEYLAINFKECDYELEYDTFDLIGYIEYINQAFVEFLDYFTYHKIESVSHVPSLDLLKIVYDDTKVLCLSRKQFNDMMDRFCILNYSNRLEEDDNKITKTKSAEEFDEKKKELEDRFGFKKKQDVTFNSTLSWLANDGYRHEALIYKTIYQVMDTIKRKNYMEYCRLINNARSNGTCNMKEGELRKINNALCLY